ncbi:MAG: TonB family protein [Novosphingobium sp.]
MAYADQKMSGNKLTALIIVALIHLLVGYALVTGLAYSAAQKVLQKVTTVDIKEEVKKEEPPPPPPPKKETAPPPPLAPPVKINIAPSPPQIVTVTTPPPPAPIILAPPPAAPPPAPPPPKVAATRAVPRGSPGSWATSNDYPSRALREEREGTTGFRVSIGTDGRVTDCQVTSSSGSPDLDAATCDNVTRRARFKPATDSSGQPVGDSYSNRIRWVIPK